MLTSEFSKIFKIKNFIYKIKQFESVWPKNWCLRECVVEDGKCVIKGFYEDVVDNVKNRDDLVRVMSGYSGVVSDVLFELDGIRYSINKTIIIHDLVLFEVHLAG
jgi:hypothetical protein